MANDTAGETHFGYDRVAEDEKAARVAKVFERVARRYDLMNDLMTWGLHRRWKSRAVEMADVKPGDRVLDLAGGTGDIAIRVAKRVGPKGHVVLSDINLAMLAEAKRRLSRNPLADRISLREADAEKLPFADGEFDAVTIGFGLRNVTHQGLALAEMLRVLKPGGRLVVLEFSRPVARPVKPFYDAYSFVMLPVLGALVVGDASSYRYLAESIRVHPDRDTLVKIIADVGFESCRFEKTFFGIVAAHTGVAPR